MAFLTPSPLIRFHLSRDTPESVGLVSRRRLPFTASNVVRTFRHALGLDERRAHLQVKLWDAEDVGDGKKPTDVEEVWFAGSQSGLFHTSHPSAIAEPKN